MQEKIIKIPKDQALQQLEDLEKLMLQDKEASDAS